MSSTTSKDQKINGLIVFVKNAIEGQVKTRLAKTIGQGQALSVYLGMQNHLAKCLKDVPFEVHVLYSSFLPTEQDCWAAPQFQKGIQKGNDLGERMDLAIQQMLSVYQNVLLIGSDIAGLNLNVLQEGFQQLEYHDIVIGPTKDGGYYLIGMKKPISSIFQNMTWSHEKVMRQTIEQIQKLGLTFHLLPELSDIDTYEDWVQNRHQFES
jgi:rSAM/selenodomain-associated transferase 1